jgi:hypothetical protein
LSIQNIKIKGDIKMKKKIISSVLVIAFASIVLTSCGSSSGTKVENKTVETTAVKEKSQEEVKKEFVDSIKQLRDGELKTILDNCKDVNYEENPNFFKNKASIDSDVQLATNLKSSVDKIKSIDGDETSKKVYASFKSVVELLPEFNQMRLDFNKAIELGTTENKRIQVVGKRFQVNNAVQSFDEMLADYTS